MQWLRRNRDGLAQNIVVSAIFQAIPGVSSVAIGWWASLWSLPPPLIFMVALITFAIVVWLTRTLGLVKTPGSQPQDAATSGARLTAIRLREGATGACLNRIEVVGKVDAVVNEGAANLAVTGLRHRESSDTKVLVSVLKSLLSQGEALEAIPFGCGYITVSGGGLAEGTDAPVRENTWADSVRRVLVAQGMTDDATLFAAAGQPLTQPLRAWSVAAGTGGESQRSRQARLDRLRNIIKKLEQ